jgi:D-aminopeptidase
MSNAMSDHPPRRRLRDLGIAVGRLKPGPLNCITDVPGIRVGESTVISDSPHVARTGVTVIVPGEDGEIQQQNCFAGYHSLNGNGEVTGLLWIEEAGLLSTPIALTNTHQVGVVRDALITYESGRRKMDTWMLPVVAETYDGYLNNINAPNVTQEIVHEALRSANAGAVREGNTGGGTGMICHAFKGGTGSASRQVNACGAAYTVGVLVQANYGAREGLRLNGVPVGTRIPLSQVPSAWPDPPRKEGSIIAIIATDAPLLPGQCKRLAQRATIGLARTGGVGYNSSGDIFVAFSTVNKVDPSATKVSPVLMLPNEQLDPLFDAVAESVEEAIWNALTCAETMTGLNGHTAQAIPIDALKAAYSAATTG